MTTNGHGGARLGAGRKPKIVKYNPIGDRVEDMIAEALPAIIAKLIEQAKEGDVASARYLCDRLLGRVAKQHNAPATDMWEPPSQYQRMWEEGDSVPEEVDDDDPSDLTPAEAVALYGSRTDTLPTVTSSPVATGHQATSTTTAATATSTAVPPPSDGAPERPKPNTTLSHARQASRLRSYPTPPHKNRLGWSDGS
jgi:hypothetical protein